MLIYIDFFWVKFLQNGLSSPMATGTGIVSKFVCFFFSLSPKPSFPRGQPPGAHEAQKTIKNKGQEIQHIHRKSSDL
jgi:hypothetical protein